jgi:DNA-binding response OmpR family regulator
VLKGERVMKGPKLLIVDHDVAFVDRVITQLKKNPIAVSWVVNSKNLMARIECIAPDVMILNAGMPDMDAIEILKKIRVDYPLIEVIMLAEQESVQEAIIGMQWGAVDYLKKPVAAEELIRKITHASQKKQKRQEKINRFKSFLM